MQNGFLNWGKLEMEMECDDLSWKKVLAQYSDRLLSFALQKMAENECAKISILFRNHQENFG